MGLRGSLFAVVCSFAAASAALMACNQELPSKPPLPPQQAGGPHLMYMHQEPGVNVEAAAAANAHLNYYGGKVIPNVKVVVVFWGSGVNSEVQQKVAGYYSSVTNSPYFDWLSEYNTNITAQNGQPGTNQHIGRGTYSRSVTLSGVTTSGTVDDSVIQSTINSNISSGVLPAADADTLYAT